jgi:hypothetical protein
MDFAIAGPRLFALGVCLAGVQAYLWYACSRVTSAYMSTVASGVVLLVMVAFAQRPHVAVHETKGEQGTLAS